MILLAPIETRGRFGEWLNDLRLLGEAVEVGTHRGVFAAALLSRWKGKRLYCVDPWANPPGYEAQAQTLGGGMGGSGNRDADMVAARMALARYGGRAELVRALSVDAACQFLRGSLDFVYVDGDHSRDAVEADVRAWWPKVRPGGILAGHDFLCPGEIGGGWACSIQPPVLALADDEGLDVLLVVEAGLPWSWAIVKGGR